MCDGTRAASSKRQEVRMNAKLSFLALALLVSMSSFAEDRSVWRTSADVQEGVVGSVVGTVTDVQAGNRFVVAPDDDKYSTILVDTDALTTRWNGFGGTINGSPEIFVGSAGFPNLRTADRVEVRGVGRGVGNVRADTITLLGRPVEAPQTGVGQTRDPGNISTPTGSTTTPSTSPERLGRIEGIVRSVNADEGRVVIETDNRALMNIRATTSTPVRYKGDTYRISNLEQGDRIRIDPESGTVASGGEIRARSIDVLQGVQDSSGGASASRQIGNLSGRVTRVDRANNRITVDSGRGPVTVDLTNAVDASSRPVRARDVMAGDHVDITGAYTNDTFNATVVRWQDDSGGAASTAPGPARTAPPADTGYDLGTVTIYGTVTQTLRSSPQLVIRDSANNLVRIYAVDDLVVKTRTGGYSTADRLTEGESVAVRAYRDASGNFIAQTIRLR
jgi:hypothetical protein